MVSGYSIRKRLYLSPRILVRVRTLEIGNVKRFRHAETATVTDTVRGNRHILVQDEEIGKGGVVAARQQKPENVVDLTDTLKNDPAEHAGH